MKKFCEKAAQNSQLRVRESRAVDKNTFSAYETSWETEYLESESNRIIYAELIDWKRERDWRDEYSNRVDIVTQQNDTKIIRNNDDHDEDEEVEEEEQVAQIQTLPNDNKTKWWTKFEVQSQQPKTLREIALEKLAKGFKKGKLDKNVTCRDAIDFGLKANINLPFIDLLDFDNEEFWMRKVKKELENPIEFEKLKRKGNYNWKQISIELNFRNFVENIEWNAFNYDLDCEKVWDYTHSLRDYIENLQIRKLKVRKALDKEAFPVVNFLSEDCDHVSLEFLAKLTKLKSLSIEFSPGKLKNSYHRRLSQVSSMNIKNLAFALKHFKLLTKLEIVHSNLEENEKIFFLLTSLGKISTLKILNLSHCKITSKESGQHFEQYLSKNNSLEHLELRENNLNLDFCTHFAAGIAKFKGKLAFLGLAFNPILRDGLKLIISSIAKADHVQNLNICGCAGGKSDSYEEFVGEFSSLIESSKNLKFIDFSANEIPNFTLRQQIIDALDKNFTIKFLINPNDFPSSARTALEQQFQVEFLNLRNTFYAENPILRQDTFTEDDEIKCNEWLRRTRNPALLKYKRNFVPSEVKVKHENRTLESLSRKEYENFLFTFHPQ